MNFDKQVSDFVDKYKKRLRATAKLAVQDTVNMAQVPVAKGGLMRVDTGFLRASIAANVGGMPAGPSRNSGEDVDWTFQGSPMAATLVRWNPEDETLYVGWTANYARPREYRDGFMRTATDKWPETVDRVARKVRQRI